METTHILQIEPKARLQIEEIAAYIQENGYPETAERFALLLFDFAESLVLMPDKYVFCRKPAFKRWNYRCATFRNNYIFVYKITYHRVVLKQIIHGKLFK